MWWVRQKRDAASAQVADREALRDAAAGIQRHVLGQLADHLEALERRAVALGAKVHWVRDAADHNAIVHRIVADILATLCRRAPAAAAAPISVLLG